MNNFTKRRAQPYTQTHTQTDKLTLELGCVHRKSDTQANEPTLNYINNFANRWALSCIHTLVLECGPRKGNTQNKWMRPHQFRWNYFSKEGHIYALTHIHTHWDVAQRKETPQANALKWHQMNDGDKYGHRLKDTQANASTWHQMNCVVKRRK